MWITKLSREKRTIKGVITVKKPKMKYIKMSGKSVSIMVFELIKEIACEKDREYKDNEAKTKKKIAIIL